MCSMTDLLIYGAGGFGREVAAMLEQLNAISPKWHLLGFIDDGVPAGTDISHYGKVIGDRATLNAWPTSVSVVLCIGNPKIINQVVTDITNPMVEYPNIIADDFSIHDNVTFKIGRGNIIKYHCTVTTDVTIGDFNTFNGSVVIGHDVIIGDYNIFMPGVRISGEVSIGNRNLFGAMSFVKQCLNIGNDIILSPLSPLLTKPKDGNTYIGNPAKKFII